MSKSQNVSQTLKVGLAYLCVSGFIVSASPHNAFAQSANSWFEQPTMTGNWGGARTALSQAGIDFHATYLSQVGSDAIGGKRQGTDYAQQVTLGADWNLQKLLGLNGGTLHTYVEDRVGRGVSSDYVGSSIEEDGVYGSGENFRLLEMAYEQTFLEKRVDLLTGYFVESTEFAYSPLLCNSNFLSNAFCGHPQFLGVDTGYNLGPIADWGGRIKFFVTPNLYVETGAFEVNPELALNDKGFDLGFQGATGAMVPVEIGYTADIGPDDLVGHYKIGGIYDTSQTKDVEYPAILRSGRYAGWLMADQMVYKVAPGSNRGLILFGEAGIADKTTSTENAWLAAGFVFQGPFAARPYDTFQFGWAEASVNPRAISKEYMTLAESNPDAVLETAQDDFELGYSIQATRWLSLTPDVQYVLNPGALSYKRYPDAWVFGLQTKLVF